ILRGDVRFGNVLAAAVRTSVRQRHVVGFINTRRHATMSMSTMPPAPFAARLAWLLRRPLLLAKRSGLAFAFPLQLFDALRQLVDPLPSLRKGPLAVGQR